MNAEEVVSGIVEGVNIGSLTLEKVFWAAALFLAGIVVIKILMKFADRALDRAKNLASVRGYVRSALKAVLWLLLVIIAAGSLGVEMTSLVALLSVAALAVSLALQNTLSNLAGGIMVLAARPFVPGDYIEADGVSGTVSQCGLAYTRLNTFDNKEVSIPNSQIAAAKIINYSSLGRRRLDLEFSASYDAPTRTVKEAIQEVVDALPKILPDPAPEIHLLAYQSSSIRYTVRVWVASGDYWELYFAIQEGVREAFARHGVEMTYEHLNVHLTGK